MRLTPFFFSWQEVEPDENGAEQGQARRFWHSRNHNGDVPEITLVVRQCSGSEAIGPPAIPTAIAFAAAGGPLALADRTASVTATDIPPHWGLSANHLADARSIGG
jgi:hypothetical protein